MDRPRRRNSPFSWLVLLFSLVAASASAQDFMTLKGHGGPIMGLSVSEDGQVASASFDNSVGLWDRGVPLWLEGHTAAVVTVNFEQAPIVMSGGDDFRVLALAPGFESPIEITRHKGKVAAIALAPDGKKVASAGWDGFVNVTNVEELSRGQKARPAAFVTQVLKGHHSNVTDVGFSPEGTLYSTSSDGTLREWDSSHSNVYSNRVLVKHGFGINQMIIEQDWIAYGAVDGGTRVVDRSNGEEVADLTLERRPILAMSYHADTAQLAVGDGQGYIMMIDTREWRITRDFRAARQGPVWALAFSPEGDTIYAGGLDDVVYAWPVALLDEFTPGISGERTFLRDAATMPNGERQFMRKCSICHALEAGPSRKAGPTLNGLFGRRAGTVSDYTYSEILNGSEIVWNAETIDALFDQGPDHYIPGSKMPMQVIAGPDDRADLIAFLEVATSGE